jgi:acetoin utilization deacetylase AcuC-like enzyme
MMPKDYGLEVTANNTRIVTVWDEKYCTSAAPTNSTRKQVGVVKMALAKGLLELRTVPFNPERTWADIAKVHAPAYVEAMRTGTPRELAERSSFHWSPEQADAVARIWSGHIGACRLALTEGMVFHPVSGAHHADADSGGAYCTFNFLAGGARAMLHEGFGCVAVIDLDAHPGDGTYQLEGQNPGVALFDIAHYCWVTTRSDPRVEYHVVRDADGYRDALDLLPAFLERVRPDLVQYQAGMDPFEGDHVGGITGVNEAFLKWRDAFIVGQVRRLGIPLVVNLAGGYVEGVSERLHVNTVRVMADWQWRAHE